MARSTFGKHLQSVYTRAGFTQETLAEAVGVNRKTVSRWVGDVSRPQPEWFWRLCVVLSPHMTREEIRLWAAQVGYNLTEAQLTSLFGADDVCVPRQSLPVPTGYVPPPESRTLREMLAAATTVVITGVGGVGKTTLAAWVCRKLAEEFPDGIVWVRVPETADEADMVWTVQARLARAWRVSLPEKRAERAAVLRTLYHGKRCLVVLDGLWAVDGVEHLRVIDHPGRLLVTTRDRLLAARLEGAVIRLAPLMPAQSKTVLTALCPATRLSEPWLTELVARLGGLPLALRLAAGQLQSGLDIDELVEMLRGTLPDITVLDGDENAGLTAAFDLSLNRVPEKERQRFVALGVFHSDFSAEMATVVWHTNPAEAGKTLRRLGRFNLVEKDRRRYRLHPLLRAFGRGRGIPAAAHRRHAGWFIRHRLYHPQIVDGVTTSAPEMDDSWADIVAGVRWTTLHMPELAVAAAVVAHTDRPALVRALGAGWAIAVTEYLSGKTDILAFLWTVTGELELLNGAYEHAAEMFATAAERADDISVAIYNMLRQAGAALLANDPARAAELARGAAKLLETALPVAETDLETVKWVFYWLDMVYTPLVRWQPLPEADVLAVEALGLASGVDTLAARWHHLRRIWYTAPGTNRLTADTIPVARALAVRAACRWRKAGERAKADDEICWTGYRLHGRYSQRAAERYARRRSNSTPRVSPTVIAVQSRRSRRWWLGASEQQRVGWLSRMLRRSLAGNTSARAERWLNDILRIGILGEQTRHPVADSEPPAGHWLNEAEWAVLRGERGMPVIGRGTAQQIEALLADLEADLGESTDGTAAD